MRCRADHSALQLLMEPTRLRAAASLAHTRDGDGTETFARTEGVQLYIIGTQEGL